MPTYRRRPYLVQAEQWSPEIGLPYVLPGYGGPGTGRERHPAILTHQEHMPTQYVNPGDWIVTDEDGKRRVYTPDAFAAAFEEA